MLQEALKRIYIYICSLSEICNSKSVSRVDHAILCDSYLYAKILEVNLFAFVYRLFHEDFSPFYGALPDYYL